MSRKWYVDLGDSIGYRLWVIWRKRVVEETGVLEKEGGRGESNPRT